MPDLSDINNEEMQTMIDRYGTFETDKIVNSPAYIAEFEDWVKKMEADKEIEKEMERIRKKLKELQAKEEFDYDNQ